MAHGKIQRFALEVRKAAILAALCLLTSCGTMVYSHDVAVVLVDLPPEAPYKTAVFDNTMGQSREWVYEKLRSSTAQQPAFHTLSVTGTTAIGSPPRKPSARVSFAVPEISDHGYFVADLVGEGSGTRQAVALFMPYKPVAGDREVRRGEISYTAEPLPKGWRFIIRVNRDETAAWARPAHHTKTAD